MMPRVETLENRVLLSFNPTGAEEETLWLLNRLRQQPAQELQRMIHSADTMTQFDLTYYQVNLGILSQQWASLAPVPPLAWNATLYGTAKAHSRRVLQTQTQAHNLPGELQFGARIRAAGYDPLVSSENLYAFADNPFHAHAGFAIDWGNGPGGIQSPAGHRHNVMSPRFREVGIGTIDATPGSTVGPTIVTEDFGTSRNFGNSFLVGAVYRDSNKDGAYNAGEGIGGARIHITGTGGTFDTTSMSAGGYQVQLPRGTYTITASGSSLGTSGIRIGNVMIGTDNVEKDFVVGGKPMVYVPPPPPDGQTNHGNGNGNGHGSGSGSDSGSGSGSRPDPASGKSNGNGGHTPKLPEVVPATPAPAPPPPAPLPVPNRVLTFDGATSASFTDADGELVTVSLKGKGSGTINLFDGNSDAAAITVDGATARSQLFVRTAGHTHVGGIFVHGSLDRLIAPNADLVGNAVFDGSLKTLRLGDASGGHAIVINDAGQKLCATFASVSDLSLFSAEPVKSIDATEWLDTHAGADTIAAPSIGRADITGDLQADIHAARSIGAVRVGGAISHARIFAGVADASSATTPAQITAFADPDSVIQSISSGSFEDSLVAATSVRSLHLGTVQTDNAGRPFGVTADKVGALGAMTAGKKLKLRHAHRPSDGLSRDDLTVTLV